MYLKWPIALLVTLVPIVFLVWRRFNKSKIKPVIVAEAYGIEKLPSFIKIKKRLSIYRLGETAVLILILACLALLSARPQTIARAYRTEKSRDIVLLLDVSGSMKEYIPPMLEKAQEIIEQNPSERFSIVTFAGIGHTALPLTRDPVAINNTIEMLNKVYKDGEDKNYRYSSLHSFSSGGTDIGEGVLTAVNRFDNLDQHKARNVILLSDLEQTGGEFDYYSEHYLEKVSLLPKNLINFYVIKAPAEMGSNDEIIEYGGGKVFEVDSNHKDASVETITANIMSQILNNRETSSSNLLDNPNNIIAMLSTLILLLSVLRLIKRKTV